MQITYFQSGKNAGVFVHVAQYNPYSICNSIQHLIDYVAFCSKLWQTKILFTFLWTLIIVLNWGGGGGGGGVTKVCVLAR